MSNTKIVCPECGGNQFKEVAPGKYKCLYCGHSFVNEVEQKMEVAKEANEQAQAAMQAIAQNTASMADDMKERLIYKQYDAVVSNRRMKIGGKTYAIRNIAQVKMKQIVPEPKKTPYQYLGYGCGCLTAIFAMALVGGIAAAVKGEESWLLIIFYLLFVLGLWWLTYWLNSHKNAPIPLYSVSIEKNSGGWDIILLNSEDEEYASALTNAINEAIGSLQ